MSGPGTRTWAWVDGAVVAAETVRISASDQGLLLGIGVFETLRAVREAPFAITRHLARLRGSASRLEIPVPWPDSELDQACGDLIAVAGATAGPDDIVRVRITVTAGPPGGPPTLLVTSTVVPPWPATTSVITGDWVINERSALAGVKSTSRAENVVAAAAARRAGADEAIVVTTKGFLSEGTASNLFLEVGGVLCTPSMATGCLAGVTRDLLLEHLDIVERDDLTLDDLSATSEAFLSASTRDVHPIATVDGRRLPLVPGPLTRGAAAGYAAVVASSTDP